MSSFDLVVALYREDTAWMKKLPKGIRPIVYNKSGNPGLGVSLPNVGREAHSYLHHIVEHYDELADVTIFCQGRPFDHVPDFQKVMDQLLQGQPAVRGFLWMGFVIDADDACGKLFCGWSKNEDGRGLDLAGFYRTLFGAEGPATYPFFLGAHFAVTHACVRSRPIEFYQRALELSLDFPDAAHCFERCWDRVFGVDGIPGELKPHPMPLYLRPVKRLGITWDDVPVRPAHHR